MRLFLKKFSAIHKIGTSNGDKGDKRSFRDRRGGITLWIQTYEDRAVKMPMAWRNRSKEEKEEDLTDLLRYESFSMF